MTVSSSTPPSTDDLVGAVQRTAGIIAARDRGDSEGARELLSTFPDHDALTGGALLVAQLALGLLAQQAGRSVADLVTDLAVDLERSVHGAL